MQSAVTYFENTTAGLHVGKANPNLLNGIKIEYFGSQTPLNHLASISAVSPRLLVVQPFDPQIIISIEKAIKQSELGLNPQRVANSLHLSIPPLSEERQKAVSKHLSQLAEIQRVAIRNIRREAREEAKTLSISDKEIEKLTAKFISQLDALFEAKFKEFNIKKLWK